eukprot:1312111-Lingulodinium_polyedra.AAC.1
MAPPRVARAWSVHAAFFHTVAEHGFSAQAHSELNRVILGLVALVCVPLIKHVFTRSRAAVYSHDNNVR